MGEKNTKYFHACTIQERRRNRINSLRKESGQFCRDENEIGKEIAYYFGKLFSSSNPSNYEAALECIPEAISRAMNADLVKPVSK